MATTSFEKQEFNSADSFAEYAKAKIEALGFKIIRQEQCLTNGASTYTTVEVVILSKWLANELSRFVNEVTTVTVRYSDHLSNLETVCGGIAGIGRMSLEAFICNAEKYRICPADKVEESKLKYEALLQEAIEVEKAVQEAKKSAKQICAENVYALKNEVKAQTGVDIETISLDGYTNMLFIHKNGKQRLISYNISQKKYKTNTQKTFNFEEALHFILEEMK